MLRCAVVNLQYLAVVLLFCNSMGAPYAGLTTQLQKVHSPKGHFKAASHNCLSPWVTHTAGPCLWALPDVNNLHGFHPKIISAGESSGTL